MAPNWMKDILHTSRTSVHIDRRTVIASPDSRSSTAHTLEMSYSPPALERCISAFDPPSPTTKSPDSGFSKHINFGKYQIWPRMKRQFTLPKTPSQESITPFPNRSPTSLSDNAVHYPAMHSGYRGASLSQRRKVSVPELRRKPAPENFRTAESALIESRKSSSLNGVLCLILTLPATLGGFPELSATLSQRPKLRTVASDVGSHSRSSSCPDDGVRRRALTPVPDQEWMTFNPTRPLSPIFSPLEANTPTSVVVPSDYIESTPATQAPPMPTKAESFINVTPTPVLSRKVILFHTVLRGFSNCITACANFTSYISYLSPCSKRLEDVTNSQQ